MSSEDALLDEWMIVGENGDLCPKSADYLGMELSFKLVRGLPDHDIRIMVQRIIDTSDIIQIVDLFILMFITRNCRGGNGERDLFISIFLSLYTHFPLTCHSLLPLIPQFGRWKDLITIAEKSGKFGILENSFYDFTIEPLDRSLVKKYLKNVCMTELGKQIKKDWIILSCTKSEDKISLASKWAPRENGAFHKRNSIAFNYYVDAVLDGTINSFLNEEHKKKEVRKIVSSLCKKLDVAEQKMCSGRYSEIDYTEICSVNLNKFFYAHLNEKINGNGDFRFPSNLDRVLGRKNLLKATRYSKTKLQPHEIVSKFLLKNPSTEEKKILEVQWGDLRSKISSKVKGNFISVADVSESMKTGNSNIKPINVSIAMSILLSEIADEDFRDRVITFSQMPHWVHLSSSDSLEEKINKIYYSDCENSLNINLIATFQLILSVAIRSGLKSEDLPDLVIFADIDFDSAIDIYGPTQFEIIDRMFLEAGLIRPKIIHWNLNGDDGIPVTGSTPNTVLLSGYSHSLFKYLLFQEDDQNATQLSIYKDMIDDKIYDSIRSVISSSSEGILSSYSFTQRLICEPDRVIVPFSKS